ncbi:MAG: hypothetical protein AAFY19_06655 [Pseudomonadota bacterium]
MRIIYVSIAAISFGFVALFILLQGSPCDEKVRGFEERVASDLNFVSSGVKEITAGLSAERARTYQDKLEFSVAQYGAIEFCKTECRLLEVCLRRQPFGTPANACPTEYQRYQDRVDDVLALLERLDQAKSQLDQLRPQIQQVQSLNERLAALEASAGANNNATIVAQNNLSDAKLALDTAVEKIAELMEPAT